MNNDIRWKQRFENLEKSFAVFQRRMDEYRQHPDAEAYQMALIHSYEMMYELSWRTLKDYLENEGLDVGAAPKGVLKNAFQYELITEGELWMEAIKVRNHVAHTYEEVMLYDTVIFIAENFYPIVRDLYHRLKREL